MTMPAPIRQADIERMPPMTDTSPEAMRKMAEKLDHPSQCYRQLSSDTFEGVYDPDKLRVDRQEAAAMLRAIAAERQEALTIKLLAREDGGLRIYSPDVRGLVLSHSNRHDVILGLLPALDELGVIIPLHTPPET